MFLRHCDSFAKTAAIAHQHNREKRAMQCSIIHATEPNGQMMVKFLLEMNDVDLPLLPSSPVEVTVPEVHVPTRKPLRVKGRKPRKNPNLSWLYRKQELQALSEGSPLAPGRIAEVPTPPSEIDSLFGAPTTQEISRRANRLEKAASRAQEDGGGAIESTEKPPRFLPRAGPQ